MTDFSEKRVLVIGGSRGIGAAIVRRFAADGGKVLFSYAGSREAATELAAATGTEAIQSDAADRDALIALIRECGPFDILVVNAGAFISVHAHELDPDAVDGMIDINVRAPYFAAVEAARRMPNGGRIVIIASSSADQMTFPGAAAYALVKSAVQGLARGLARDFGDRGITINIVQPGQADTDMTPADGPMSELMHSLMATRRHAAPEGIAGMVAYLAGPDAGIVTGTRLTIDGGFGA
jgi:cyclic-di-GMP-binding biofilm dispersal mediator protein